MPCRFRQGMPGWAATRIDISAVARSSSAIWVGEIAGDISRHRGEPSSRRPQTIDVVSSPILNLDPETKIIDVPHSLNDRQLNEDHLRQAARMKSVIISPI
jgi:hypothetical protein